MSDQILEALEIGLDCAIDAKDMMAMGNYRWLPEQHVWATEGVRKIEAAIALHKDEGK